MSHESNDQVVDAILDLIDFQQSRARIDNLFSANHRNAMIQRSGYTDAMAIRIQDLLTFL